MVEEAIADLYPEQEMRCPVHLSIGQEAPAVGVCHVLGDQDLVVSGHRSHAHYLARGGDLGRMLAELYGRASGCTGGLGGSMHLTDPEAGFLAATPIVGSSIPVGVGAALTAQTRGTDQIVVVFLGDGAMETGVLHESINFAVVRNLPVLFCCEDNLYSVYSPMSVRQPASREIRDLAAGHGIRAVAGNGNDVEEVVSLAGEARAAIRSGSGPFFLALSTYRWREHCGPNYDNNIGYRTPQEFESWKAVDPIEVLASRSVWTGREEATTVIEAEIRQAVDFAMASPFPDADAALSPVSEPR